jgi:carbon-monoxide dehydrogenase medium subunit
MIPNAFEYFAPTSLDGALNLLAQGGEDAKLLAGGHSLLPMMKLRLTSPARLIDLGRIAELRDIREEGDTIAIGAMTTHADIKRSDLLRRRAALLPETAAEIGDVQVRNRGTIGGSAAHADPAGDYPAALLALEAQFTLASTKGTRTVAAKEFFVDILTTVLEPGEILTGIRLQAVKTRSGAAYCKLHQPASGFALVGVAAHLVFGNGGRCQRARVAITGVASKPYRATAVERLLERHSIDAKRIATAAARAAEGVEPRADMHASARYRAAMAQVFARRALTRAFERACAGR